MEKSTQKAGARKLRADFSASVAAKQIRQPKTTPLSIRLTLDERADLMKRSGGKTLSVFARELIVSPSSTASRRRAAPTPIRDHATLAKLLALLGRSELAASLRTLAAASHNGSLIVSDETTARLDAACADIRAIRAELMRGLGLEPGGLKE